jgi:hypothetical protein
MIVNQKEAETKSCPHVNGDMSWHCVGSCCMAWRWWCAALPGGKEDSPARIGYCGLAGKPEYK